MWPDDRDLPIEAEVSFGANLTADPSTWSWTDLSSRLQAEPIRLRAGKSSGAANVSPGTCSVALDNDDGALTPLHPMSAYFPHVRRGTPVRVRLRRAEDAFADTTTSGWGTADTGQAWTPSGAANADFSVAGGVARHSHPTVNGLRRTTLAVSLLDSEQIIDVAPSALLTGAALVTGILFRYRDNANYYWLRCEFNSGGTTVMLKISRVVGGAFTDLATVNPLPGVPYAAGSYLRVRASVVGSRLSMKVWNPAGVEPAGWNLTATDSTITAAGATGVQSWLVAGNTNTLPVEARFRSYALRVDRFNGFADQWEPTFQTTTTPGQASSVVRVTASGLLRRLEQGAKPARSAPARYIPTTNPVAYWPLEDGQLVSAAAALAGGAAMRPFVGTHPSGAVVTFTQWGRGDLAPWLPQAVSRTGNRGLAIIWAPVTMPATSQWAVDFMYRSGTDASDSAVDINPSYLGGGLGWPQLLLIPELQNVSVSINGEPEVSTSASTLFNGQPHHVRWAVAQSGSSASWTVYIDGTPVNAGATAGAMTLPAVSSIALTAAAQSGADIAQGHVAVWTTPPPVLAAVAAAQGHIGETAAARIARLCAEESITVSVAAGDSEPLGPQAVAGLMDLLREAEAADMGVLYELGYGLGYRPRGARYNAPVTMTVDLATYRVSKGGGRDVLSPVYDDQDLRNEWTVERRDGSTATARDVAHQAECGVYSDSIELNIATDDRLPDHAGWRVHLGTVDELREQTFPLDLAANPELLDGWLGCGVGSRLLRTNPPAQHQPGALDRLVEGWTETIGPRSWQVQVTPAPATPWDVAVADGGQRAPADGSTLAASLSSSGPTLSLASTAANGPWATDPGNFPQDLRVGGERVTASAIGPALSDTFTRTVSGGWGTADTGQAWTVDGTASQYSVVTSLGVHAVNALNTVFRSRTTALSLATVDLRLGVRLDLAPTGSYIRTEPAVRIVDTNNYYGLRIHVQPSGTIDLQLIRVAGGAETLLAAAGSGVTHTAGIVLNIRVQAEGSTLRGRVWRADAAEPGAWQVTATDSTHAAGDVGVTTLFPPGNTNTLPYNVIYDDVSLPNVQTVTLSARGVNGVQRAWPAGTEVDVWQPAIAPL